MNKKLGFHLYELKPKKIGTTPFTSSNKFNLTREDKLKTMTLGILFSYNSVSAPQYSNLKNFDAGDSLYDRKITKDSTIVSHFDTIDLEIPQSLEIDQFFYGLEPHRPRNPKGVEYLYKTYLFLERTPKEIKTSIEQLLLQE